MIHVSKSHSFCLYCCPALRLIDTIESKQGDFMKKVLFFYVIFFATALVQANGIFLWEYSDNGHRSCCIHLGSVDICNPDVPCTKTVHVDLMGIYDYIGRILALEKSSTFPFYQFFKNAQAFLQKGWAMSLSYRFDYFISDIKFYHDLAAEALVSSKLDKAKSTSSNNSATTSDKAKQDDAILKYLMKLGLAKQIRR